MRRLTKRAIDAAGPSTREYFVWCGVAPGFGIRIYPSGRKVFVAQVRVGRATRRLKIGPYGPFTVDQARKAADEIIRDASNGVDPQRAKREARDAPTVGELCETYLDHARAGLVVTRFRQPKRMSTIAIDEGRVSRHIKPVIGSLPARDLIRCLKRLKALGLDKGSLAPHQARLKRPRGSPPSWLRDILDGSNPASPEEILEILQAKGSGNPGRPDDALR